MPILTKDTLEFISRSPEQTCRLGARLGRYLTGSEVVALEGGLGAGKTVFAQGVGMGWGATSRLVSPTYVLIRRHKRHQDDAVALSYRSVQAVHRLWRWTCWGWRRCWAIRGLHAWWSGPTGIRRSSPRSICGCILRMLDEYRRSLVFQARGEHHQAILNDFRQELLGI